MELGDQKPSQLTRKMQDLALGRVTTETLLVLCQNLLPPAIRAVLAVSDSKSEDILASIADKVMEKPGHTYMECDNMHSTIERASEYAKIYTPDDWQNVIRLARKDNPYNVQVLEEEERFRYNEHTDFLDFKAIGNHIFPAARDVN
ncbi:unnamed protein product [Colias eurytheme]|nr:unnamed protein product [Colias eurytheme]